jgi:ribonuclease HII
MTGAAKKPAKRVKTLPDFHHEEMLGGRVAGVDEVGRGPWAGPVVAAAVILDPANIPAGLNDSKVLTRQKREQLMAPILKSASVGIGQASVEEIDQLNILQASLLAMRRAVEQLAMLPGGPPDACLVDGNRDPGLDLPTRLLVKGDAISLSIAAASIVAKVTRDRIMSELAVAYPAYGWERNAGYGVPEHRDALQLVGISPHHRKSFAPIRHLTSEDSLIKP